MASNGTSGPRSGIHNHAQRDLRPSERSRLCGLVVRLARESRHYLSASGQVGPSIEHVSMADHNEAWNSQEFAAIG
jgi:hypothetical protein